MATTRVNTKQIARRREGEPEIGLDEILDDYEKRIKQLEADVKELKEIQKQKAGKRTT